MKDPAELLHQKEQEIQRVKKEIAALKLAAPLLEDDESEPAPREKRAEWRQLIGTP
jgi:hypothetical protein